MLPNDLEHRIHQAILALNEDPYKWADVIYTLVDCRKELESWQNADLNSGYNDSYRSTLDVYSDQ